MESKLESPRVIGVARFSRGNEDAAVGKSLSSITNEYRRAVMSGLFAKRACDCLLPSPASFMRPASPKAASRIQRDRKARLLFRGRILADTTVFPFLSTRRRDLVRIASEYLVRDRPCIVII